jgi:thiol-disulfide isomerase/thioredoxin
MASNGVVRNTLKLIALIGALQWGAGVTLGQESQKPAPPATETQPAVTLKVGDKAPPLKIEKWIKGGPVADFEQGKVYVLECWATWCGPCIASMPHLSAVQKAFKDKGVTVIGVDIWEALGDKVYTDETLKKVEDFVKEQGDRMGYTVAYDGKSKAMDAAYMRAAGQNGIPTAFLIDKTGTIAWIGHPMWLDVPVEAVVADKWDRKTGPEQVAKGQERLNEIYQKLESAPKEAVAAFEAFERDFPAVAHTMPDLKFTILLGGGDYDKAYKLGAQLVDDAIASKDSNALNSIAWTIVDPEGKVAKKDLDLALKAATKADELTKHENAPILDTLARVYFVKGDIDKAIELETKAVELAQGTMKVDLQGALDEYKEAKAKKK